MEFVPKFFVAGVFTAMPLSADQVNRHRMNQIWADVAGKYDEYTQLQVASDGRAAQFVGQTAEEGVTVQPPLIQVRDSIRLTAEKSADKAADIFRIVSRHLSVSQFFNLGLKHVYHFAAPGNDARAFLLNQILGKSDEDVAELAPSGVIPGLRYYVPQLNQPQPWTVEIEPLLADSRVVIVSLDAQFAGPIALDAVMAKSGEARDFVETSVNRYIDRAAS